MVDFACSLFTRIEWAGQTEDPLWNAISSTGKNRFVVFITLLVFILLVESMILTLNNSWAFLVGPVIKNLPVNAGDLGLIPGLGRSFQEGNGNSFQFSCLGNPMDRGAWRAIVQEVAKSCKCSDYITINFCPKEKFENLSLLLCMYICYNILYNIYI